MGSAAEIRRSRCSCSYERLWRIARPSDPVPRSCHMDSCRNRANIDSYMYVYLRRSVSTSITFTFTLALIIQNLKPKIYIRLVA